MRRLVIALNLSGIALLAACGSAPVDRGAEPAMVAVAVAPARSAAFADEAPAATVEASAAPVAGRGVAAAPLPAHRDPQSAVSRERLVFFRFDDAAVRKEYGVVIDLHAKHLVANPDLAVRIEGHADERGSAEYNLALGQRRAESVQRALQGQGVKPAQMEARSWGEERPREPGHGKAAYSQNRRVELVYPER